MYKEILMAAAIALGAAEFSIAQTETTQTAASSPAEFAAMAAQSNMLEIESSRLVLDRSKKDVVRAFAQKMIDDHGKAGNELKEAAAGDKVTDVPAKLDASHQAMLEELTKAKGEDFDRAYSLLQAEAHEQAVKLFTQYAQNQGELAGFARKTLPHLQEHLEMARDLSGKA